MDNSTATYSTTPVGEEMSDLFKGLTKAEEVVVCAAIVVGVLGVTAIILRLIMPIVRRRHRKSKENKSGVKESKSTSDLLGAATPSSSASRASTISGSSQLDWKAKDNDATTITTIASDSYYNPKNSVYGNLRTDGVSLPMYLPKSQSEEQLRYTSSAQRLNEELTAVISTPSMQRLNTLNLDATYRDNWDRTFDPTKIQATSLSHITHPSESRRLPEVHRPVPKEYMRQATSLEVLKTRF